ncbi:M48 family metallopeptidase [Soonwooa sp.]|uniref:M48 family metalloprotease n=1 Tax=Soonwooa sp. TaxID=1938592 RepID=UPI00261EEF5E|nr:M48 family metallopeptidase [Soonwooa sp.]
MYIDLSENFKKQNKKAVWAIVSFIIVYFLIFLFSCALTAACIFGGLSLIIAKPAFYTLMVGAGLIGFGGFVFYFVIKFLFKKHENNNANLVEIKREDQPKLFALIDEIVAEVGTDAPKKTFLSNDVNACVFYDSSFWSMFRPVKKNLNIGLGLVNATTAQELKAILAHEFGHFSQKSMKVGSYVYNVNQIIFNLVNEDEAFERQMQSFSQTSGYFSFFGGLASLLIRQIQKILRAMYAQVNVRYMALSREMEFHADEVAANVAGSKALAESLLRLDLANKAYNNVIDVYNQKYDDAKVSPNLYIEQSFVMNFLAEDSQLDYKYNLPVVKQEDASLFNKSKLVFNNQWSSHPSNEDRIQRLNQLNIIKEDNQESAWSYFTNVDEVQKKMTQKLFSFVNYTATKSDFSFEDFQKHYCDDIESNRFPIVFNNYFDQKNIDLIPFSEIETLTTTKSFEDLFSNEKVDSVYTLIALENDLASIKAIGDKLTDIKTFDYDGTRYSDKDALSLAKKIESEIEDYKKSVSENDKNILAYFYQKSIPTLSQEFEEKYARFYNFDLAFEERAKIYTEIDNALQFVSQRTQDDTIKKNFEIIKPLESELKINLRKILANPLYDNQILQLNRKDLEHYVDNTLVYFHNGEYFTDNLKMLFLANNEYARLLTRTYFLHKKDLLQTFEKIEAFNNSNKTILLKDSIG